MKILFFRHGPAVDRDVWSHVDAERPLTNEGKQAVQQIAKTLRSADIPVDLILSSPFLRAVQTAEIIAQTYDSSEKLCIDPRLSPGCNMNSLKKIMEQYGNQRSIMIVGHEPDLSLLAADCIGGGRITLKKAGVACVQLNDFKVLTEGSLVFLINPKILRGK